MTIEETLEAAVVRAVDRHMGAIREALARLERGQAPQFVTVAQAAEALECHQNTIRRMVEAGQLRYKRVGRGIRIDASSLHGAGGR
jgi:excisionase family DNA binding protein